MRMVKYGYTTGFANYLLENDENVKDWFRKHPLKCFQRLTSVMMNKDQLHEELISKVKKLEG